MISPEPQPGPCVCGICFNQPCPGCDRCPECVGHAATCVIGKPRPADTQP